MSSDGKHNTSLANETGRNSKVTLPDFDSLRDMAKNNPEELERLRLALCNKVINKAPSHAKQRLRGLMFQINARRKLAKTNMDACVEISSMMNDSLKRMQAMLKDLRSMQAESIVLSTKQYKGSTNAQPLADILPFKRT